MLQDKYTNNYKLRNVIESLIIFIKIKVCDQNAYLEGQDVFILEHRMIKTICIPH